MRSYPESPETRERRLMGIEDRAMKVQVSLEKKWAAEEAA